MNVHDIGRERVASATAPTLLSIAPYAKPSGERATDTVLSIIDAEILDGFRAWPIWTILGWDDIRQRYRRSVIGPFWITLSMAMFIFLLGIIYGRLFKMELKTYIPYLSVGFILWGFIAGVTNESCQAFHEGARMIKQIKLPYLVFVLRVVWRNFIIFLHNIVIFIPVAVIFKVAPGLDSLYALPGLLLVIANVIWVALFLAIVSTRYRDLMPIVSTIVQITMFATPIMWTVSALSGQELVAELNPVYHLIELVRAPLLGTTPELRSWAIAAGLVVVGSTLAATLLVRKSRRIVFWL
jgi:ABC-type polysaccharide/polyol phosphate export permease